MSTNGPSNGTQRSPRRVMAKNVRELAHDAVTLGELQLELLKLDAEGWSQRLIVPIVALAGTLGLALGTVPVLLQVIAHGLIEGAEWPAWVSFLVAGLIGLVLAGGLAALGWARLRASVSVFERSRSELRQNISWLKNVLREPCEDGASTAAPPGGYYPSPRVQEIHR